jgi:excisionase family DNA binding protein
MQKQVLHIDNLTATELLDKFDELSQRVQELSNQLVQQKESPIEESDYMTAKGTAKKLKINLSTLWKWTKNGRLTAYRLGSKKYYKCSEVETVFNNSKAV